MGVRAKCINCSGSGNVHYSMARTTHTCMSCEGKGYTESANVIAMDVVTRHDLKPDQVLLEAVGKVQDIVIVGYDLAGNEYFASNMANGAEVVWLLQRANKKLLDIVDEED